MSTLSCLRSANDCTIERLAPTRLTTVNVLNLHGWKKLTDKGLKVVVYVVQLFSNDCHSTCMSKEFKGVLQTVVKSQHIGRHPFDDKLSGI